MKNVGKEDIERRVMNLQMEMVGGKYEGGCYVGVNSVDGKGKSGWD